MFNGEHFWHYSAASSQSLGQTCFFRLIDMTLPEIRHRNIAATGPVHAADKGIKGLTLRVRNANEATCFRGGMAEWFKAAVLKTVE
jgi:hypothetical protein